MNRPPLIKLLAAWMLLAFLLSCVRPNDTGAQENSLCGGSLESNRLEGLTWLAGSPTQNNILCEIRQQKARIVQSLEPDSRDPILFQDSGLGFHILVERFSGRQSRPSRMTWFSADGQRKGQRGDWPENAYGISLSASDEALVAGFDFGVLQKVAWQESQFASPQSEAVKLDGGSGVHPVHILSRGNFIAVIDNGFDLSTFKAIDAKVFVRDQSSGKKDFDSFKIADSKTGLSCLNAFQSLAISAAEVLVSCNPQYFGAARGEAVAVFKISLGESGEVTMRTLASFDGADVQKIDLLGLPEGKQRVFVAYKNTKIDDYEGTILKAGWLTLDGGDFLKEERFAGPLKRLPGSNNYAVSCAADFGVCKRGKFLFVGSAEPWDTAASAQLMDLQPELPFLSFSQELRFQ
ncbi:MAG: hypothetical protein RL189_2376 [Pseudomonadota bacterium]